MGELVQFPLLRRQDSIAVDGTFEHPPVEPVLLHKATLPLPVQFIEDRNPFFIQASIGTCAWAPDEESALVAAYQLQRDHCDGTNLVAPTVVIMYDDQHVLTIEKAMTWADAHETKETP